MSTTLQEIDDTRTLTESAYRAIRTDILTGLIAPAARLRIDALRQRHGIGASPIREALSRLVSEGLVTSEEQKGFRVARMSTREFREITELRVILEIEAVTKAIARGGDEWEATIVATHHRLALAEERIAAGDTTAVPDWEIRNRDFHTALAGACDSGWLMHLRGILNDNSQRYRYRSLLGAMRRDTPVEHRMLRDLALARDAKKFSELIARHFLTTYEDFEKAAKAGLTEASLD